MRVGCRPPRPSEDCWLWSPCPGCFSRVLFGLLTRGWWVCVRQEDGALSRTFSQLLSPPACDPAVPGLAPVLRQPRPRTATASPAPYASVATCRRARVRVDDEQARTCSRRTRQAPSPAAQCRRSDGFSPANEDGSTRPMPFWPPAATQLGGCASWPLPQGVSVDGSWARVSAATLPALAALVTHGFSLGPACGQPRPRVVLATCRRC